jgi:hypothetical protein
MSATTRLPRAGAALRKAALEYPEAHEDMPWGHHAIKVRGKTFIFLAADAETFSLSVKLPSSAGVARSGCPTFRPQSMGLAGADGLQRDSRATRACPVRCSDSGSTRAIGQWLPSVSSCSSDRTKAPQQNADEFAPEEPDDALDTHEWLAPCSCRSHHCIAWRYWGGAGSGSTACRHHRSAR